VVTPGKASRVYGVSGYHVYVAAGYYKGLQVVDVSNPAKPKIIGSVDTPKKAHSLYVSGNHVYIAYRNPFGRLTRRTDGLQVVDVSNPATPKIIGSVDMPEEANGVYVSGKHAYIAYRRRNREDTYILLVLMI